MRKAKLIEDYSRLVSDTVSATAHSVVRQTTASPFLTDGTTLVQDLAKAVKALDNDVAAVDYPSPAQTAYRISLREAVTAELGRLAKRLNLDYPGDGPALLSSGLTLADTAAAGTARTPDPTTDPVEVELLDGSQAGCLLLKIKRPRGTTQNLIRYTTDPTLPEEHWLVAVGGGRERQLGPFASGTRVHVKVAALTGSTTEPVYTAVKSRIVQ